MYIDLWAAFVFVLSFLCLAYCRPSEDDVSVLRKELVHAQQLMDTITQEKEKEIKEHVDTIRNTENDRKRYLLFVMRYLYLLFSLIPKFFIFFSIFQVSKVFSQVCFKM